MVYLTWIKERVEKVVKRYHTNHPLELASFLHIHVIPFDLHEDVLGFYMYDRRNKYIFYNKNLENNICMRNFIIAHELGHAILHTKLNTPYLKKNTLYSIDKIEKEANRFAVELLLPDSCIYDLKNNSMSIYETATTYGIPVDFVHLKKF